MTDTERIERLEKALGTMIGWLTSSHGPTDAEADSLMKSLQAAPPAPDQASIVWHDVTPLHYAGPVFAVATVGDQVVGSVTRLPNGMWNAAVLPDAARAAALASLQDEWSNLDRWRSSSFDAKELVEQWLRNAKAVPRRES